MLWKTLLLVTFSNEGNEGVICLITRYWKKQRSLFLTPNAFSNAIYF